MLFNKELGFLNNTLAWAKAEGYLMTSCLEKPCFFANQALAQLQPIFNGLEALYQPSSATDCLLLLKMHLSIVGIIKIHGDLLILNSDQAITIANNITRLLSGVAGASLNFEQTKNIEVNQVLHKDYIEQWEKTLSVAVEYVNTSIDASLGY